MGVKSFFCIKSVTCFLCYCCSVTEPVFATPWTATRQSSLFFTVSCSLLRLMSIELMIPSNHLILSFSSCSQSFPVTRSFLMSWLFTSGSQSMGNSASVLPIYIQDWFPLRRTGWISLQSRGFLKSSPTPQFKSIKSSALSFLYSPTFTSIHDYWKSHSLD